MEPNDIQTRSLTLGERLLSRGLRLLPVKHGRHRALDRICRRAWKRDILHVNMPFSGQNLRIAIDELVGWHFAILRSFDPEVVEILLAAGQDIDDVVFWDVGANKGACSYSIAANLPFARVVAIEPQSALEADLKYNLQKMCPGRHRLFRVGLGERDEVLSLVISKENTGKASLHMSGEQNGVYVEQVEVVRAQRIVDDSDWGWPALVKIDVEGHESAVVRTLRAAFSEQKIKALVFECHKQDEAQIKDIIEVVDGLGYSIYGIVKSIYSTKIVRVTEHREGMSDYVIISDDFMEKSKRIQSLISES